MIVQMSQLGPLGRLGNQIFAFFFLKVLESEIGCEIRYPEWLGNALFDLPGSPPPLPPDEVVGFELMPDTETEGVTFLHKMSRDKGPEAEINAVRSRLAGNTKVLELAGYFQYHMSTYARQKDLFLGTFRISKPIERQLDESLAKLGLADRPIVCVHVRRGDYLLYGPNHQLFWGSSFDAMAKALSDLRLSSFRNHAVYLCSDDIGHCKREFEERDIRCFTNSDLFAAIDDRTGLIADFMMMARSDAMLIANSSLSFAAAALNRNARVFLRPCPKEDRYIAFDPWNSHALLPKFPYHW